MQHMKRAGGKRCMEVDHFRPRGSHRNLFTNLVPATRHCNGSKSQTWPTKGQQREGIRLINPFIERDYGKHIFEDPTSNRLVGVTPAGQYQIIVCDLNAPHFVEERKDRSRIHKLLESSGNVTGSLDDAKHAITELRRELEQMIPPIPLPPVRALAD